MQVHGVPESHEKLRLMRWMDNYLIEGNKDMPDYEVDHKAKLKAKKNENKAGEDKSK